MESIGIHCIVDWRQLLVSGEIVVRYSTRKKLLTGWSLHGVDAVHCIFVWGQLFEIVFCTIQHERNL